MLEYEGDDLEDVFMQSFQVSYKDVFGCDLTHELKEKGADVHVNQENKKVSSQKWRQILLWYNSWCGAGVNFMPKSSLYGTCIKTCTVTSKVCSFSIFVPFRNLLTCILTSCSTSLLRSSSELLSVALIWWPTRVRYESCSDRTRWSSWSAEARWDIVTCILVVKITGRFW